MNIFAALRGPGRVAAGLLVAVTGMAVPAHATAQAPITFTRDIAPIIFEHCASCHRPGDIAPFSLLTYLDARPRATAMARVTRAGSMPPWKPAPGYGPELVGARRLDPRQIDLIQRWVDGGALEGDRADLPPPLRALDGWRLGEPDLVIRMAEPYTLPGGGRDVLRNFVIPVPVREGRYVRGLEFRPGNNRVVHHANIRIDRSRASRRLDETDPGPGYDGRLTTGEYPDGHFLGWTPGQLPPLLPEGMSWRLEGDSDVVVQLHMHPADGTEIVQPSLAFFFTDRPPGLKPMMLRLGRQNIDIPPGERHYEIEDQYVLPVAADVYAVQPHAHYRARQIRGFATLPDGTRQWLIYINDWDFNWQDVYRFRTPVALPKGTTLSMHYTYDNSAANRANPNSPPTRVRWGQNSADEMGDLWIQVLPRTSRDRDVLHADFGPKVMAEDAAGYETILEGDWDNARLHEAVAAIYMSIDRADRAIAHLMESLRVDPGSVEAHYNLATALVWQGRLDESLDHFERVLQLSPDHVAARINRGAVLRSRGRFDAAIAELRQALARDPGNAAAHTNLAGALAAQGNITDAIAGYRMALRAKPDLLEPLTSLAWILATSPEAAVRQPEEAVRLAERAAALASQDDVRVLDTLAAAYAAGGDYDRAAATAERALRSASRRSMTLNEGLMHTRLDLYRRRQPYRDPALAPRD